MASPEDPPTPPQGARTPSLAPASIALAIGGRVARAGTPRLCERVRALLEGSDTKLVVCDVGALIDPDVETIDALARAQLTARRLGGRVRLRNASSELQELLSLAGLCDVVPLHGGLRLESWGQAEEREQGRGVEEEADPHDPTG